MSDNTYNGWTNRETWQVNVWIGADNLPRTPGAAREEVAELLREDRYSGGTIMSDIITDFLQSVNWQELIDHQEIDEDAVREAWDNGGRAEWIDDAMSELDFDNAERPEPGQKVRAWLDEIDPDGEKLLACIEPEMVDGEPYFGSMLTWSDVLHVLRELAAKCKVREPAWIAEFETEANAR